MTLSAHSLTFTAGNWSTAQTVTVSAGQDIDAVVAGAVTLTHTASGGDYDAVVADSVTVAIYEYDLADPPDPGEPEIYPVPPGVSVAPTELTLGEGASAGYVLGLSEAPAATVTVTVRVLAGSEATVSPERVELRPEDWSGRTVTVRAAADDDAIDDVAVLVHDFTGGGYHITGAATVVARIDDDDTAGVTVTPPELNVGEGGSAGYTVVLDTAPSAAVTVDVSGHAGTELTLSPERLTFTAGNWSTPQAVTVSADDDDDTLADAPIALAHAVGGAADYASVAAPDVTVTIVENDSPTLAVAGARAPEGGGPVAFEVSLSTAGSETVTVDYATSDGTAAAGSDYTAASGTLSFAADSAESRTIEVEVLDDAADEEEEAETFTLTLSGASGATLAGGEDSLAVIGVIDDDDDPEVTVSFAAGALRVAEGGEVAVIVTLSADPEREVTIPLTVSDGGTTSTDYAGVPASLVFARGTTERRFIVRATDDRVDDDGERVTLGFGALPQGVTAGSPATAEVSIDDDDARRVTVEPVVLSIDEGGSAGYTVVLDTEPSANVSVVVSGRAGTDLTLSADHLLFTPANWSTAQRVTVSAAQDGDGVDDEVTLSHTVTGGDYTGLAAAAVAVTVADDDPASTAVTLTVEPAAVVEGAGVRVVTVTAALDGATRAEDTVVSVTVSGATATADTDFTAAPAAFALTIDTNAPSATATFALTPVDDLVEEDDETVEVGGVAGDLTVEPATITLTDDDAALPAVSVATASAPEGEPVVFTVTLAAASGQEVTVDWAAAAGGTATAEDFTATRGTLTFEPGVTEKTVDVKTVEDALAEQDETFTFSLSNPSRAVLGAVASAVGTITDDDEAGVTVTPTGLGVTEGGDSADYTVVLDSEPTATVTVTISGHGGTDVSLTGATLSNDALTFTTSNWDTVQTVTVSAREDEDADNHTVTLTHEVASTDSGYDGATIDEVTVTVTDDDTEPGLTLGPATQSVDEEAGERDVHGGRSTRSAGSRSGREVRGDYATADGPGTGGDGTLTFSGGDESKTLTVAIGTPSGNDYTEASGTLTFSAGDESKRADGGHPGRLRGRGGRGLHAGAVEPFW